MKSNRFEDYDDDDEAETYAPTERERRCVDRPRRIETEKQREKRVSGTERVEKGEEEMSLEKYNLLDRERAREPRRRDGENERRERS